MKGFILAAGFGKRLNPITEHIPKSLLPVGNLPLIAYSLKLLAHYGIKDIIINLHHMGKSIKNALGNGSTYGVNITYSEEDEILGTGGGLKKMCAALGDGTFVVVNADTILDVDLSQVVTAHKVRGALATMVLRQDERQAEFGQLSCDNNFQIQKILGQGHDIAETLKSYMFAGVHVMEPKFLEYIPPDVETCIVRYAYSKALQNNELLSGFVANGYWSDVGTPERFFQANVDALSKTIRLRHADPLAGFAIEPKRDVPEVVRMGSDVDLGSGIDIRPPVIFGNESRIGDHAKVGPFCVIGAKVQIGKDARVINSILLDGTRVDNNAIVENAICSKKEITSFQTNGIKFYEEAEIKAEKSKG